MKRLILLTIAIAAVLPLTGQESIKLSFVAAPSINWMLADGRNADSGKPSLGYDFGIQGDYYFSDNERYALSSGLLVTNIGGNVSYNTETGFRFSKTPLSPSTRIKYELRYLEIPFNLKLKTDEFGPFRYWGLFGLSGMVNIAAKGSTPDKLLDKDNISDEISRLYTALNIGVGLDYNLGNNNSAIMGIVFQNGLSDLSSARDINGKTIINSLRIRFGFVF